MRCLHIYPDGTQCPLLALEEENFCVDHLQQCFEEPIEKSGQYAIVRRLGALLLLGLFLLQLIVRLRAVYGW